MKKLLIITCLFLSIYSRAQELVTLVFTNDWEDGTLIDNSYNHFRYSEVTGGYSYAIITDATARVGAKYARIEVRQGDRSDITAGTSRAEVYAPRDASNNTIVFNASTTAVYRINFSLKFDASWTDFASNQFATPFQIKAPAGVLTNPLINLSITDAIRIRVNTGDQNFPSSNYFDLTDGSLTKGKWIDFQFTIKWAADNTGYIHLDRRNEGNANYMRVFTLDNAITLAWTHGQAVGDHYMKFGLYRSDVANTSILYNDDFRISTVTGSPVAKKIALTGGKIALTGGKIGLN